MDWVCKKMQHEVTTNIEALLVQMHVFKQQLCHPKRRVALRTKKWKDTICRVYLSILRHPGIFKRLSGEDRNALTVPSRFHKLLIFPEVHHVVERDRKKSRLKATSQADTKLTQISITLNFHELPALRKWDDGKNSGHLSLGVGSIFSLGTMPGRRVAQHRSKPHVFPLGPLLFLACAREGTAVRNWICYW